MTDHVQRSPEGEKIDAACRAMVGAALPIFLSEQASEYGTFTVGVIDDLHRNRFAALTDPPPMTAWTRHLLEHPPSDVLTWDGHTIRMTLDNGSWVWVAEGQSPHGDVIFGRWPD